MTTLEGELAAKTSLIRELRVKFEDQEREWMTKVGEIERQSNTKIQNV